MPLKEQNSYIHNSTKERIEEKRRLRKIWQTTKDPRDKRKLNKAIKELKQNLHDLKNEEIKDYLSKLTATQATNYSLWKATKKLNQPKAHVPPIKMENGNWARSDNEKASTFANHLVKVFQPFSSELSEEEENEITEFLESPAQMSPPISGFNINEIKKVIGSSLKENKSSRL